MEGVALTLLGAIIWRSTGEISVREYNGTPANMIWFHVNNDKFVMTYNHSEETVELKDRTHTGAVIASFNNSSTYEEIISTFRAL